MKIFISHKWEDSNYFHGLKGFLENPNNQYMNVVLEEREDLRPRGQAAIMSFLKQKIKDCDRVICLIGQDTHSSDWVEYELAVATSLGKKIVPIQIPGTTGGSPKLIRDRNLSVLQWNAKLINNALY